MLSQAKMVRRAIESQYTGTCTVTEHQKIKKGNGSTGFTDSVVLENEPCRLSFATSKSANSDEVAVSVTQSVKVFLSPDIVVKPGSKMTITQNGRAMRVILDLSITQKMARFIQLRETMMIKWRK